MFAALGYEVELKGKSGDGGVDLIMRRDGENAIVQCKRHRGTLSPAVLRDLYGTMQHLGATKAYLFTTGRLSSNALSWIADKPIVVIDRETMHQWLRHADYAIKKTGVQVPLYDTIEEPEWKLFSILIIIFLQIIFCVACIILSYAFFFGSTKIIISQ